MEKKRALFLMLLSLFMSITVYAANDSIPPIGGNSGNYQIYLNITPLLKGNGTIKKAPPILVASAYLCGSLLSVSLYNPSERVDVTVVSKITGMTVLNESFFSTQEVDIDLDSYTNSRCEGYYLYVSTPSWERYGEFNY